MKQGDQIVLNLGTLSIRAYFLEFTDTERNTISYMDKNGKPGKTSYGNVVMWKGREL